MQILEFEELFTKKHSGWRLLKKIRSQCWPFCTWSIYPHALNSMGSLPCMRWCNRYSILSQVFLICFLFFHHFVHLPFVNFLEQSRIVQSNIELEPVMAIWIVSGSAFSVSEIRKYHENWGIQIVEYYSFRMNFEIWQTKDNKIEFSFRSMVK